MVLSSPRSLSKNKKSEAGFSTTLIGIILISLLFVSYNIFLNQKPEAGSTQELSIVDKIKERLTGNSEKVGVVDDMAAMDSRDETVAGVESDRSEWVATDYTQGDIQSGSYVVKEGDTLWEIAEAVYGDGGQWHKILDANKDSVGFLPNGSQALIITDQSLTIPQ